MALTTLVVAGIIVVSDDIVARLQSQLETNVALEANMGEMAPPSLANRIHLAYAHSRAVARRLNECQEAKNAAHKHVSLVGREKASSTSCSRHGTADLRSV